MIRLQTQFLIRVHYKGGTYEEFWVSSFTLKHDQAGTFTEAQWAALPGGVRPLNIGLPEIAAVWQVDQRTRLVFGGKR